MKRTKAVTLLLIITLGGPVLAETAPALSPRGSCPLDGPLKGATEECRALRIDYRAKVESCMEQMHAEADARAGRPTKVSAHANKSRYFICDAETRSSLQHLSE